MTNINDAAATYANILKQASGGAQKSAPTQGDVSFGDILKESAQSAINAQRTSESTSAKAITGDASMTDVLSAINDAEIALNTVLAIRDKVVQAYEEVMRTPI